MKIHTIFLAILSILLVGFPFMSYAAGAENFEATVPVDGYSSNDYNKALPAALTQVLIKLSANPDVTRMGAIQNALQKPGKFVQSYRYASVVENGAKKVSLVVKFSPKLVEGLLRDANQYVSASTIASLPELAKTSGNAQTIVWLVERNANGQFEVLSESSNPVVAALNDAAKQQGITLLWPVMDLQDISAVSPDQIDQLNEVVVENASRRYEPDAILIGKIEKGADGTWQGHWKWLKGMSKQLTWQTTGADPSNAATAILSYLSASLMTTTSTTLPAPAASSAVSQTPQINHAAANLSLIEMRVSGIRGLRDYANVVRYLKTLHAVVRVNAQELQGEIGMLTIQISGGREVFENELSAGRKLAQDIYNTGVTPTTLSYYWNPNAVHANANVGTEVYVPAQSVPDDMVVGE